MVNMEPLDEDTRERADQIAALTKGALKIETAEDVSHTVHAFLVLFALHAKLLGLNKDQATKWFSNQWDGVQLETRSLLTMPPMGKVS